jgi:DNA-binding transcriptional MerR regulator
MEYYQDNIRKRDNWLAPEELLKFERDRPDGISSAEIVDIFSSRGIKFSEATLRKYVQHGLLPRSRRVGQKGKHKGSKGIYPIGTLRQINEIKRMMSLDYTLEEIQQQFAFVGGELEELRLLLASIMDKLQKSLSGRNSNSIYIKNMTRHLEEATQNADKLVAQIADLAQQIRDSAQIAKNAI